MSAREFYVIKWETVEGELEAKRVRSREFPKIELVGNEEYPNRIRIYVKNEDGDWEPTILTLAHRLVVIDREGDQ